MEGEIEGGDSEDEEDPLHLRGPYDLPQVKIGALKP